jgi:hypothetical protein
MKSHVLNWLQTRWALSLSRFWFVITYHLGCQQRKSNALPHYSYLVPKEGDVAYEQQCDVILTLEHLWFRTLLITPSDKTFLHRIHEDLKKHPLVVNIQSQLKNQHQIFFFLVIMSSLSLKWFVILWWSFVCSRWPCSTSRFQGYAWCFSYKPLWI